MRIVTPALDSPRASRHDGARRDEASARASKPRRARAKTRHRAGQQHRCRMAATAGVMAAGRIRFPLHPPPATPTSAPSAGPFGLSVYIGHGTCLGHRRRRAERAKEQGKQGASRLIERPTTVSRVGGQQASRARTWRAASPGRRQDAEARGRRVRMEERPVGEAEVRRIGQPRRSLVSRWRACVSRVTAACKAC